MASSLALVIVLPVFLSITAIDFIFQSVDQLVSWVIDRQFYLEDKVHSLRAYAKKALHVISEMRAEMDELVDAYSYWDSPICLKKISLAFGMW